MFLEEDKDLQRMQLDEPRCVGFDDGIRIAPITLRAIYGERKNPLSVSVNIHLQPSCQRLGSSVTVLQHSVRRFTYQLIRWN
ncbi:MAG: hypothetical protein H3Z50_03785 [archaeon]|nr:hypothetical protein [archaeon]MCP8305817.1 hypothetical protein [archaeon]